MSRTEPILYRMKGLILHIHICGVDDGYYKYILIVTDHQAKTISCTITLDFQ